ncbi:MAG: AMP-binding protein, partial [Lachnospiraceae bacterium]|nr:AMP-binding protein [Lachnospiraceae bacterium]
YSSASKYGQATAYRYKVKKELVDKSFLQVKNDAMAISRMVEALELKGKHIAILGSTSYPWITSFFGITGSGSVAVPLDVQLPAADLCELLDRADAEMLIFDEIRRDVYEAAVKNCPKLRYFISMQQEENEEKLFSWEKQVQNYQGEYDTDLSEKQLCTILFTSGTTGKSKGVMLSHENLTQNAMSISLKLEPGTVSMTVLPINHVYCLTMDIIKGLEVGICCCINDSIMHVAKNMKLFQPQIMLLVPLVIESIYAKLRAAGDLIPKKLIAKQAFGGRLNLICSGGAYLNPDYVEKFKEYGITILQGYGMTECAPVISTNLLEDNRSGSVGKLIANCEGKIVDEEIWVRGSSVMQGYYNMPEETAQTLEDGWLKTGDLGYIDEDNYVYITGRKKNLIILANGENVSPEEIENEIGKADLVKEIVVREAGGKIQAEIYPDTEFAKKKRIKDIPAKLQEIIDDYNKTAPVYKRVLDLKLREVEFEKNTSRKIKRT